MTLLTPRSLIKELRRRKVFTTIAIYIVGAWVALQVAELLMPALDLPERAIRWVWLTAISLFPLVVMFGWRYDISSGGIRLTPPKTASETTFTALSRGDHWWIGTLATMAVAVIALAVYRIGIEEPLEPGLMVAPENSVAVLPFGTCEESAFEAGIARQLAGEVISELAKRDRLKVTGRVTSFIFADRDVPLPQMAGQLAVEYILTGVWCHTTGTPSLELELLDADGRIQWRDRFDQVVNSFGQVDRRIPTQVAERVATEFGDVVPAAVDPPVLPEALMQLRIGRDWLSKGQWKKANAAFEKALELQPDYPEPLYALALRAHPLGVSYQQKQWRENQKPLLERALKTANEQSRLYPNSASAHYTAGVVGARLAQVEADLAWREEGYSDYAALEAAREEAEHHLVRAVTIDPSLADAYTELALILPEERLQEKLEWLERGATVDPYNARLVTILSGHLISLGRHRQAFEVLGRFRDNMATGYVQVPHYLADTKAHYGYYDEVFEILLTALEGRPPHGAYHTQLSLDTAASAAALAYLGLTELAAEWWELTSPGMPKMAWISDELTTWYRCATGQHELDLAEQKVRLDALSDDQLLEGNKFLFGNRVGYLIGLGELERARTLLERYFLSVPQGDWGARGKLVLAWLYELDGRHALAEEILIEAATDFERRIGAGYRDKWTLNFMAEVQAMLGNDEGALDFLEQAIAYHAFPSFWDTCERWVRPLARLEDHPRYRDLMERVEIEYDRQARVIEDMLSQYDIEELLQAVQPPPSDSDVLE